MALAAEVSDRQSDDNGQVALSGFFFRQSLLDTETSTAGTAITTDFEDFFEIPAFSGPALRAQRTTDNELLVARKGAHGNEIEITNLTLYTVQQLSLIHISEPTRPY